jgi:hypothetical protein
MITLSTNRLGVCEGEQGRHSLRAAMRGNFCLHLNNVCVVSRLAPDQAVSVCFAPIVMLKSECHAGFLSFTRKLKPD